MQIRLDDDQWVAATDASLGDVFAELSERAQERSRIVTSVLLDQRAISDRDFDPGLLAESSSNFMQLTATSQSIQDIMEAARHSARRYARVLQTEGTALLRSFRSGQSQLGPLDLWLGRLADYIELTEASRGQPEPDERRRPLSACVRELLEARTSRDTVLLADLLEYEIIPRLTV